MIAVTVQVTLRCFCSSSHNDFGARWLQMVVRVEEATDMILLSLQTHMRALTERHRCMYVYQLPTQFQWINIKMNIIHSTSSRSVHQKNGKPRTEISYSHTLSNNPTLASQMHSVIIDIIKQYTVNTISIWLPIKYVCI